MIKPFIIHILYFFSYNRIVVDFRYRRLWKSSKFPKNELQNSLDPIFYWFLKINAINVPKNYFLLATQVSSLSVQLHNLFHTESDNTLCFVKQVHNGTNVFMKSHLNRFSTQNQQQIWIFFCCHSLFTFKITLPLSFLVTGSQLSQCLAVRNSVVFLTKIKTKAWLSVLRRENSNLLFCEVFLKSRSSTGPPLPQNVDILYYLGQVFCWF